MNSTAEIKQLFNSFTKISENLCHLMQTTDDDDKKKQMRKDFNEVQKLILAIHKYKIYLQLTNIY